MRKIKLHHPLAKVEIELRLSLKGVTPFPDLPFDTFIQAMMSLIAQGKATWDGKNIHLIESGKQ